METLQSWPILDPVVSSRGAGYKESLYGRSKVAALGVLPAAVTCNVLSLLTRGHLPPPGRLLIKQSLP